MEEDGSDAVPIDFGPPSPEMMPRITLARAVMQARIARGLTRKRLAELAGVGESAVGALESSHGVYTPQDLERISKALDLKVYLSDPAILFGSPEDEGATGDEEDQDYWLDEL